MTREQALNNTLEQLERLRRSDLEAFAASVVYAMDGQDWDADTHDFVSSFVRQHLGIELHEPSELDDDDDQASEPAAVCGHGGCQLRPGHIPGHTDR